MFGREFYFEHV